MVKVKIELYWGKKWNGSYYEETKGQGVYASCMEYQGNSFRGCPMGRTDDRSFSSDQKAIEAAISDFVFRGKYEYTGSQPLTRALIEVVETRDYRK